jgi:hypothetical protein
MINHLRTLLINTESFPDADLEEFIPMDFRGVPLKTEELAAQRHLVPMSFPRRTRNFIASVLDNIARSHSRYDAILSLDPRILGINSLDLISLYPKIEVTGIGEFSKIEIFGQIFPRPSIGLFSASWRLLKNSDSSIAAVNKDTAIREVLSLTFNDDSSDIVALGDSGISLRVIGSTTVPDFETTIKATSPIQFDAGFVLQRLRADQWVPQLFEIKDRELASELQKDFFFGDKPATAIGAVLIAYAVHISERIYQ